MFNARISSSAFQVLQQQLIQAERQRILEQAKSGETKKLLAATKRRLTGGDEEEEEEEDEDEVQVRVRKVKKGL